VTLKLSRAINTYITYADSEIDTAAEFDVTWRATEKIRVDLGYVWQHSDIAATDIDGVLTPSRVDRLQTPTLSVRYQALDWLLVKPYAQYQTRASSNDIYTFDGTLYGIDLEVRWPLL
jgi:hypothetical protein